VHDILSHRACIVASTAASGQPERKEHNHMVPIQTHHVSVLVDGKLHHSTYELVDDCVEVYAREGVARAPLRRFKAEELAQILTLQLVQRRQQAV
jgi:hypothetical protein